MGTEDAMTGMTRAQRRQMARALGWRGSKTKRNRKYIRPELAPSAVKILQENLNAQEITEQTSPN
jgi:hypothetical protein